MKSRIGLQLVIAIVLFSSLITLVTTGVQLFLDYRADMVRISNYELLIKNSHLESIAANVWLFNEKQIRTQLNGLLHLPDMEHLEIHAEEGLHWAVGAINSNSNVTRKLPLYYRHKGQDVFIGVLHATVSLDNIYSRLFRKAVTILIANGIKTFLVSGFTLLILQYLLTRHLVKLAAWISTIDVGRSFEACTLSRPWHDAVSGREDELDVVVAAINRMQENLGHFVGELSRSEKKYKTLIENIPLRVFHKDRGSVYVACNGNYATDLHIEADQIAGSTDFDYYPQPLAEKYRADDRRIMETNTIETIEESYVQPGGRRATVQTIKAPIVDEEKKVIGLLGAFIDISEVKRAQEAARQSEDKFRRLLESLQDSYFFYSHDMDGNFTSLSPSITDVLGYSEKEFMTHYTEYLTDNPINREAVHHTEKSMKGIHQPPYDLEIFHKNGMVRLLSINETPVFDSEKNVVAVEGLAHDVTENRKVEVQLRQAQKMEAIGTLAGGIAHDFNNLLGAILGFADMAKDDAPPDSSIRRDLEMVLDAGFKAKELVKQILAFSRQADIERFPLHPAHLIKEAVKLLTSSIPATIEIRQKIEPNCGAVLADPTEIHQIVMNLCTNAFHAMEESGGRLQISLSTTELLPKDLPHEEGLVGGTFLKLTVSDSGPGIPQDVKDKIFDPYFTTKAVGKGTGMGLAIIHGIVTSLGGFVQVESEPDAGAAFHVFLPQAEPEAPHVQATAEKSPPGQERVLLVDDEQILADMGQQLLERLGYSVTVRTRSLEALETFQNQPDAFDLLITDMTMPGMTGKDLARRVLQIRPDMPIIVCTGYSTQIDEAKALQLGIKGFAFKPLVKKDIAVLIRKVLDG